MAGLLLAVSCQRENVRTGSPSPRAITLSIGAEPAFFSEEDSKIALSNNNPVWEGNETMSILIGNDSSTSPENGLQAKVPSAKNGVFTGDITLSPYNLGDIHGAVVPADNGAWYNGADQTIVANIAASQTQTWAGTFMGGNVPFFSFVDLDSFIANGDNSYTFRAMTLKPACAILRLNFFGTAPGMDADESLKSVTLYSADGKDLAGTVSRAADGSCTLNGTSPVTLLLENGTLLAGKARNQGVKTFISILPYGDAGESVTINKVVVTTDKADYTATFAQELTPCAGQVIQAAIDMAGFGDREIHNMFSSDGGETWSMEIPAVFRTLAVSGKLSDATLSAIREAINLQPLPVSLDLTPATPLSSEFPAIFTGASTAEPFRQLLSIKLPEGITSLATGCFKNCAALQSVELPTVMPIAQDAFYGCLALESFDFSKVNYISIHAFAGTGLKEVDLTVCPEGTVVEKMAFNTAASETAGDFNTTMTSLKIGKNVSLNPYAFYRMGGLTYLYIDTPTYARAFTFRDTDHYSMNLAHHVNTTVELGPNASGGGTSAFWCNSDISKLIINEGVTSLGNLFALCGWLSTIECHCVTPPTIGANTFRVYKEIPIGKYAKDAGIDLKLYVPAESESEYNDESTPWKTVVQDKNGFELVPTTF